jgi:DNA-binding SARP family transcriptional activator
VQHALGVGMGAWFGVLGDVEARVDGRLVESGHARQRCVLAVLLVEANHVVSAGQLVDRVWGGQPPHRARETLYNYLSRLRHVLGPISDVDLVHRSGGYVLTVDQMAVDLHRFYHLAAEARTVEDEEQALAMLEHALGLWRGEAFAGIDTPWISGLREGLERARFAAELDCTDLQLRRGGHGWLLNEIATRAEAHPLDERVAGQMMLALYQNGRQAAALDYFSQVRSRLAEDLGIDPSPALQELQHDILTHAPALTWHPPPRTRTVPSERAALGETPLSPPPEHGVEEVFVGRQAALERLAMKLKMARSGRAQAVLVAGEPGIGKTSLLRHFAQHAGVAMVWGACPEQVAAPPLWPWEQVLRAIQARWPEHVVPGRISELLDRDAVAPPGAADVAGAVVRRYEAIGEYLSSAAHDGPLVVVIDDLHWTDRTSLQLLAYLAEFQAASRVMLVASYRPQEDSAVLADTLAALSRCGAERIELDGLDRGETLALAQAIAGRDAVTPKAARALHARTGGNPFFLRELIRFLDNELDLDHSDLAGVPPAVREVVLRRLTRLPDTTATLLSMAAVAGREFDLAVVAEAASLQVEAALEAIDPAVAAGLVVEDDKRLGWFAFSHALVAEALYEATGRWRRTRLHHRIGQITARIWDGHEERAAEIARHWLLAAELGPNIAAQASAYAAIAASVADARLAHEAASESWKQALAAADLASDHVDLYPLLIGLATSLYRSGDPRHGTPVFVQAMEEALAHEESQSADISRLITVAVAALCESNWYPVVGGADDLRLVDVLERALPRLTEPVQRALLLSFLAAAHYYDDNPQLRVALSHQALTLARPAADYVALAHVLYLRALALFVPDYSGECLAAIGELLSLPDLPLPMVAAARVLNAWLLATVGRVSESAAQLDQVALVGEHVVSPIVRVHLGWARASLLLLDGQWAEAEEVSRATYNWHSEMSFGVELGIATRIRMIQRWEAAFLTGRSADLIDELQAAANAIRTPGLRTMLMMALAEAGRLAEARSSQHPFDPGPQDYRWLYTQCWRLLAMVRLGDTEQVARLRNQLLPYRHMACAVTVHVICGSVAYFTGEAALTLGDPDAALADLAMAVEADEAMGAPHWLVRARDAFARAQRLKNGTDPARLTPQS